MSRWTAATRSPASGESGSSSPSKYRTTGEFDDRDLAEEHLTRRAVDRDDVALVDLDATPGPESPVLGVHVERFGAADAGLAHAAGDHRRVAGLAAATGQDALGRDHAAQIVRVGLPADQDHLLARPLHSTAVSESNTTWPTAAPGEAFIPCAIFVRPRRVVEPREHQLGQLGAGYPLQGLVQVDQALVDELGRDPEGRRRGPFADSGLQHPQLAALDGELDVAQVAVVLLEGAHDLQQLGVAALVDLLQVGQRHRVTDPGHHVLALRVLQVVPVDALRAGRRIPGEGHPGTRIHPQIPEHHRDDVHRGAQLGRDPFLPPVDHRPLGVPRVEHRPHRQLQLLAGFLRELPAGLLDHHLLERLDSVRKSAASRSRSFLVPLACLAASSASSKCSPLMPSTVLPNIWISRR